MLANVLICFAFYSCMVKCWWYKLTRDYICICQACMPGLIVVLASHSSFLAEKYSPHLCGLVRCSTALWRAHTLCSPGPANKGMYVELNLVTNRLPGGISCWGFTKLRSMATIYLI
jgi:hypothetical protein